MTERIGRWLCRWDWHRWVTKQWWQPYLMDRGSVNVRITGLRCKRCDIPKKADGDERDFGR